MATPLVEGGLYEVRVLGALEGQACVNILHYKEGDFNGPVEGDTIESFLGAFRVEWRSQILPLLTTKYSVFQYECQSILDDRTPRDTPGPNDELYSIVYGSQAILPGTVSDQGSIATAGLPSLVAAGIRKIAQSPARWARGSMRLSGLAEADTETATPDRLTDAKVAAINAAILEVADIFPGESGVNLNMVVFGRTTWLKQSNPSVPRDNYVSVITGFATNPFVTSQVSRKRRISLD